MKKNLLLCLLFLVFKSHSQSGLHFQFHGISGVEGYSYNSDTLIFPYRAANVSTFNAVGIVNLNTEQWTSTSYSTAFSFSSTNITNFVMKNLNEGICVTPGNQLALSTSNFWQTSSPLTGTVNALGATKFGYYGYMGTSVCSQCTYSLVFSSNGSTWTNSLIELNSFNPPVFAKSKTKVYTLHNNLLKASTNGGASYSTVSGTYTFNVAFPVIPKIITLNDDTIFVVANQFHRSFDGGATWSTIASPTFSNAIGQIAARNARQLMIIDKFPPYNMYYSNNSGTAWTTYTTLPAFTSGTTRLIANENFFYLAPNYKSTTGQVWQDFLASSPSPKPYAIDFTGNIGLVGIAQGYFGYSTNRGYNYSFLANKISSEDLMAVKAVDINKFLVCDRKGQIFVSTDQGVTWSQKNSSSFNSIPRKFTVSNDKNTIICTYLSNFMRSIDGGATFSNVAVSGGGNHSQTLIRGTGQVINVAGIFLPPTFTVSGWEISSISNSNIKTAISTIPINSGAEVIVDIEMRDNQVGYFVTRRISTNETLIYKTSNAWVTTSLVATIPTPSAGTVAYDGLYGQVQTFGVDTVLLSGSGNPVNNQTNFYHRSTDGGLTWNVIYTNFNKPLHPLGNRVYKMAFFNSNEYMALISDNLCGGISPSIGVYLGTMGSGNSGSNIGLEEIKWNTVGRTIQVFPNPTAKALHFSYDNLGNGMNVKVFDVMGKVMLQEFITKTNLVMNVESLNAGIYFIQAETDGLVLTGKFIKQ